MAEAGYDAFISYSHKDLRWGRWVQERLERYRMPRQMRKDSRDSGKKLKVFRDQTDLAGVELQSWDEEYERYATYSTVGKIDIEVSSNKITLISTISNTNTSEEDIPAATTTTAGLMTATDKQRLNNAFVTTLITQSEYDDLVANNLVDPDLVYLIYEPQQ